MSEPVQIVAGWALVGLCVVGAVVCWRRSRRFLRDLRVANENRNRARAEAKAGAASQAGAVARADVGGVHVHLGGRVGTDEYDGVDYDDDERAVVDLLRAGGFDFQRFRSVLSSDESGRSGGQHERDGVGVRGVVQRRLLAGPRDVAS